MDTANGATHTAPVVDSNPRESKRPRTSCDVDGSSKSVAVPAGGRSPDPATDDAGSAPQSAGAKQAEAAKMKAKLKALMGRFPLPACTTSANHMMCSVHAEGGKPKPMETILKGVNPLVVYGVQRTTLPPLLAELKTEYHKFGHRNPFLWQWLYYSTQLVRASALVRGCGGCLTCVVPFVLQMAGPSIAPEHADTVTLVKSIINIFNVVTDDIGDEDNDIRLLHRIEADLFRGVFSSDDVDESKQACADRAADPKAAYCHTLKTHLWSLARKLPRFEELKEVLEYDIRQMLNEKRYSALTNKNPHMINRTEHSLVAPHTMHAMIFLTCDLMASPSVPSTEFGMLRSIYWDANVMANIANCLGTWAREIPKRDWSSPLFPQAIEDGVFTIQQLNSMDVDAIKARVEESGVEGKLLARWFSHRDHIMSLNDKITCASAADFAAQNDAFLAMHLACRGFI